MTTAAPKGLSLAEMQLLNNFATTVTAREINAKVKITKLNMSWDIATGYSIELVEESTVVEPVEPVVVE